MRISSSATMAVSRMPEAKCGNDQTCGSMRQRDAEVKPGYYLFVVCVNCGKD